MFMPAKDAYKAAAVVLEELANKAIASGVYQQIIQQAIDTAISKGEYQANVIFTSMVERNYTNPANGISGVIVYEVPTTLRYKLVVEFKDRLEECGYVVSYWVNQDQITLSINFQM